MENGVGCFIMTYRQDLKKEEIVALISSTLEEMERKFEAHPGAITLRDVGNGQAGPKSHRLPVPAMRHTSIVC